MFRAKEVIRMPRGDGTGPMGIGPMTGRSAGYCAGYGVPGYMNPYARRGFGRGFGRGSGRGMRRGWCYAGMPYPAVPASDPYGVWQVTPQQEREMLQQETKILEEQLSEIRKRIEELEKEK